MKSNIAALDALIKKKANVDAEDVNQMTPLLLACVHGSQEVIQMLIKAKSNTTKRDQRLNTVFHIVALRGEPEYLEMMMENDRLEAIKALNKVNNEGKTPLRLAVEGNHPQTLKKILELERQNSQKWMVREKELIHFAAEKGYLEVIKELVEGGGNKNELDSEKTLPLHLAAQRNRLEVVEYLLEEENREATDDYGMTPLMLAVSQDSLECVKYLIGQGACLDVSDKDERSPVHIGAKYNALQSVEYVLQYLEEEKNKSSESARMKTAKSHRRTLRNIIDEEKKAMVNKSDRDQNSPMHIVASNGYLEMMTLLYKYGATITQVNEDEETALHRAAHSGQTGAVRQLINWDKRLLLMKDEMGNSALHLAAKMGHDVTTRVLLDAGADKEAKNSFQQTPLQVSVEYGKLETCQQLVQKGAQVESPSDARTVLHVAAFFGYDTIARFLLQMGVTIDRRDEKGRTALDVACEQGKKEVARALLETDEWRALMIPNDVIPLDKHKRPVNRKRKTPFRTLLAKFPELASLVMDKCVERNKEEDDLTLCIAHNFEFIDDTYMLRTVNEEGEGEQLIGYKSPYTEEFKLHKNAQAYSSNYDKIYKNHPLKLMANAEKLSLLSHPLSMALLKCKWNRLGRVMYYSALSIYLVFIISLTEFVRHTKAPYNVKNGDDSYYESVFFEENETCPQIITTKPDFIWKRIVQILAICQIGIEFFQLYQRKLAYLTNWENWIDCFIYSTALLTVYDFSECSSSSGVRQNWQWLLAALCIFFGWINLLFMIRKMPRFGIFVVMFVDIVKTFFRFFPVFVLFIIAFSSSFYVILQNRPEFSTIFLSPLKTTVMMIGEFEFTGIFHGDSSSHTEKMFGPAHMSLAYCLFFFFCIIMTILLMNLLVGLAVDDIKGVQEKAELRRLAMQVELVLQIEASFHIFIHRMKRYAVSRYATFPHGKLHKTGFALWWTNFRKRFGLNTSSDSDADLAYEYESEFTSELRSNLQMQRNRLQTLQENVDVMYEKQVRLEALIRSLAKGMGIIIEVEDNDS
uniref:ANK_REP_REGION domain-containing protein n=1 Tax=Caenorhabditis japonica TaxID=281687 RepID=A0A8R1DMC4_CAEJA